MVVFDSSILLFLLDPDTPAPIDAATGKQVEKVKERIEFLVANLEKSRTKIIIPTPVLSEILIRAGTARSVYLEELSSQARFKIVDFDQRAAVELAATLYDAMSQGDKRDGTQAP